MDKELKEMLDKLSKLNKIMDTLIDDKKEGFVSKVQKSINEAFKEKATISIEKQENGEATTHIEGSTLAVLITLAGLEKTVLEKLDTPKSLWELIKQTVGTMEADDNE